MNRRSSGGGVLRGLFMGIVLLFLYLPILILAFYSFTGSTQIGAVRSFSVQNYVTLFTTPELTDMIWGTILLALSAALIATILGITDRKTKGAHSVTWPATSGM